VLQETAAKPKHLGASLGFFGVLHTWSRQLVYHPHLHFVVAQGGLTAQGGWVRSKRWDYFLPCKLLSVRMRMHMEEAVRERFPDIHRCMDPALWRQAWVVHIKAAGSGEHAVDYLSRYVAQSALSSKRILAEDGEHVVLGYTESKTGLQKSVRLTGIEFIRRFLQHVLPSGFKRVRYYGWLSPAAHKRLARIRVLLDWQAPDVPEAVLASGLLCPKCQKPLQRTASWSRGRSPPPLLQVAQALFPRPP
jgi:hypothetical protein